MFPELLLSLLAWYLTLSTRTHAWATREAPTRPSTTLRGCPSKRTTPFLFWRMVIESLGNSVITQLPSYPITQMGIWITFQPSKQSKQAGQNGRFSATPMCHHTTNCFFYFPQAACSNPHPGQAAFLLQSQLSAISEEKNSYEI